MAKTAHHLYPLLNWLNSEDKPKKRLFSEPLQILKSLAFKLNFLFLFHKGLQFNLLLGCVCVCGGGGGGGGLQIIIIVAPPILFLFDGYLSIEGVGAPALYS